MAPGEERHLTEFLDHGGEPGFRGNNRPEFEKTVAIEQSNRPPLFFSRYRQRRPGLGLIEPTPLADQLMVSVEFVGRTATDMFRDQKHVSRPPIRSGALGLYDMRESWAADVREPFDNLNMFLPLSVFDEYAEGRGSTFSAFDHHVEDDNNDVTMHHLALAIAPALERPQEVNSLFLNHCFLAVSEHLAGTYGVFSKRLSQSRAGLNAKQQRLAIDYIETFLHIDMSLSDIAQACEMSVTGLNRAFRTTMGLSVHQWVIRRRVERAKRLLATTAEPITNISLACGFCDQSHLTRVFKRQVGLTPHFWRQQRALQGRRFPIG